MLAVLLAAVAHPQQRADSQNAEDRQALLAFSRLSGPELVNHDFDLPSIPIFVIRRLVYLNDPRVIPALREAFDRQRKPLTRQFIAAALVRLGDTGHNSFEYVRAAAVDAAKSDIPYPYDLVATAATDKRDTIDLHGQNEIQVWAQAHNLPVLDVIERAMFDLPGAVEALALTRDRRAVPNLLEALQSSNPLVVREAAYGLARMQEVAAIGPIIIAGQHLDAEDRPWLAKSLMYYHSRRAQEAAASMIGDSVRLQLWRADVDREEATQAEVANLSKAMQGLDRALIDLNEVDRTVREGQPAAAEDALNRYVREIDRLRKSLTRLRPGGTEDGLAIGVLDRIEMQRTELRQIREYQPGFGGKTAEQAEKKIQVTYRMMHKFMAQDPLDATPP